MQKPRPSDPTTSAYSATSAPQTVYFRAVTQVADFVLPARLMENIARYDDLCHRIIACAIAVHDALGPGLLESIYRDCLVMELHLAGLPVECEVRVPIVYRGTLIRDHLRLDLLVAGMIVVEVKSVDRIHPVHLAQVITYLKLADKPAGLLLNFNSPTLKAGLRRLNHPAVHARARSERQ